MKICVLLARFSVSGVPLAQLRLARALAEAGHDVDLVVGWVPEDLPLPVVPRVRIIELDRPNVRGMFAPVWKYLRRRKPDVVFSAEDHLNALVLLAAILSRSKSKISGSSRVTPFDTYSTRPFSKRWFLKHVMQAVTWRADALTCVAQDMVAQYQTVFRSPPHVCVYNIVDDASSRARMDEPVDDPWFNLLEAPILIAAGTLAPWKGFGDLIEAAAELRNRGRRFNLVILGEGPLRQDLERMIATLDLSGTVLLPGHVPNPLKYFSRSNVFVLSSHVEGLPNVLVEAMMCGCTAVATDCPTGPREVLQDGRFGYLVPVREPIALADGIERALDHPTPKEQLNEAVRPFAESTVLQSHFRLLGLDAGRAA